MAILDLSEQKKIADQMSKKYGKMTNMWRDRPRSSIGPKYNVDDEVRVYSTDWNGKSDYYPGKIESCTGRDDADGRKWESQYEYTIVLDDGFHTNQSEQWILPESTADDILDLADIVKKEIGNSNNYESFPYADTVLVYDRVKREKAARVFVREDKSVTIYYDEPMYISVLNRIENAIDKAGYTVDMQ